MTISPRARRITTAGLALSSLMAALLAGASTPANAVTFIEADTPTQVYSVPNQGSAITTGARVFASTDNQITTGGLAVAKMGAVTYLDGTASRGYTGAWYACGSRNQSIDSCTALQVYRAADGLESPANKSFPYLVKDADLGKYLAFSITIFGRTSAQFGDQNTQTVVSTTRAKDLYVIPGSIPTSPRPVLGMNNVSAGGTAGLLVGQWTMPAGQTFVSRSVTAFACPDANAGQVASASFTTTSCTSIAPVAQIASNASNNTVALFSLPTTAAMAGRYLVAQVNMVARSANNLPYLYVIRSAASQLPAPVAGANVQNDPAAALEPQQAGEVGAVSPPQAAPAETPQEQNINPAVPPTQPTMKVTSKRSANRGGKYLVSVRVSGTGGGTLGTGEATVAVVSSNAANAKVLQKLKPVAVEDGRGAKWQSLSKKLRKGNAYIRVIYTDAGSGLQTGFLKKVTIR